MAFDLTNVNLMAPNAKPGEFAAIFNIRPQAVSQMIKTGTLRKGDSLQQWIMSMDQHKTSLSTGSTGNLSDMRSQLAFEQMRAVKVKNDLIEGTLTYIAVIDSILGRIASDVVPIMDAIPKQIVARVPYIEKEDVILINELCDHARTKIADLKITKKDLPTD